MDTKDKVKSFFFWQAELFFDVMCDEEQIVSV